MSRRALSGFIVINVLVSIGMVFLALTLWDSISEDDGNSDTVAASPRPLIITNTAPPGELPPSAYQSTISSLNTRVAVAQQNGGGSIDTPTPRSSGPTVVATLGATLEQGIPTLPPEVLENVTLPSNVGSGNSTAVASGGNDDGGENTVIDGCEVYEVQSGDNCGLISERFGVSLEELIGLNRDSINATCTNLQVGQDLLIPSETCALPPTPTITPTITNTPFVIGTFAITNTPIPTASNASVQITQVLNFGDVTSEYVELQNTSDAEVQLLGWTLSDADGNIFTFPDIRLQPSQRIRVITSSGDNTPAAIYWGQSLSIWELGETAILADNSGQVQSTYDVGGEAINFDQ